MVNARSTRVDGIVYDNIYTATRNPCVQSGRLFGLLGMMENSDPNGVLASTLAGAFGVGEELLTIAAAASSTTTGLLLPANSLILAVLARVTVVIPTAATFSVGDATTPARFSSGVAVAAGTTSVGLTQFSGASVTLATGPTQAAATAVRITPNATPGAATGQVRIQVVYMQFTAPPA